jgi:hypothetical protein
MVAVSSDSHLAKRGAFVPDSAESSPSGALDYDNSTITRGVFAFRIGCLDEGPVSGNILRRLFNVLRGQALAPVHQGLKSLYIDRL